MRKKTTHCPHCGSKLRVEGASVCADCNRQTNIVLHHLGSSLLLAILAPITIGAIIWTFQQGWHLKTQMLGEPMLEIVSAASDDAIILKNSGDIPLLVQFCRFDLPNGRVRVFFGINQMIEPGAYVTHQLQKDLQIRNDLVTPAMYWANGDHVVATAETADEKEQVAKGMISAEPKYVDWGQVFYTDSNPELSCYENYLGDSLIKVPGTITIEFRDLNRNDGHALAQACTAILTCRGPLLVPSPPALLPKGNTVDATSDK